MRLSGSHHQRVLPGICLSLICAAGNAFAVEQRILLSFDNAGHKVEQIVRPQSRAKIGQALGKPTTGTAVPDINTLIAGLQSGFATLVWVDSEGSLQSISTEPDPRVSHAPAHISGVDESRVGERDGAWLITGPQHASSVMILLPADKTVGLAFEQWDVLLDTD